MRVLFDLMHPAHVNFCRVLAGMLKSRGVEVDIIALDRGPVINMVKKEYPHIHCNVIGRYSTNLAGVFLMTGFWRTFKIILHLFGKKYDAVVGVAAFQSGFAGKLRGIKSLIVYDDPEHKLCFQLSRLVADKFFVPECCRIAGGNIRTFPGLKEWSYLSPKYFKPDQAAPQKYGLKPKSYIFVREVDNKSLNYRGQKINIIEELYGLYKGPLTVVLSLEDKSRESLFKDWIILEEPVEDIHSLIYFSSALVSNGDSMAREGAMLGVESIYCGEREMAANALLIEKGLLNHIRGKESVLAKLNEIGNADFLDLLARQKAVAGSLLAEWGDINQVLFEEIMKGDRT